MCETALVNLHRYCSLYCYATENLILQYVAVYIQTRQLCNSYVHTGVCMVNHEVYMLICSGNTIHVYTWMLHM